MGRSNRREKKKWIEHYCSSHTILLVGEGNFSFSSSLATAFGSAANMTLLSKYNSSIETTLEELEELDCTVMHGVNVITMSQHSYLSDMLFDRIVFNFPHAGFHYSTEHEAKQIKIHQNLVRGFLRNAKELMEENGEIHITHKTSHPYREWEIEEIAEEEGLFLKEEAEFSICDYPGYVNKKGSGPNSNRSFPVGACSTFKFVNKLSKREMKKRLAMSLADDFAHLKV